MPELSEHAVRNRAQWDAWAEDFAVSGRHNWTLTEPEWGLWNIPEADIGALGDLDAWAGLDVVELGCGTAYFGSWLARRGARVTGIDNSPAQLETARGLQAAHDLTFPLHLGSAEHLPFADASFDAAISEYGASIWCDPYAWIPEAARVLRPGGTLTFMCNSVLSLLCLGTAGEHVETELVRTQFGLHRVDWPEDSADDSVEFHLPHGLMIDLLGASGLTVERLIEVQAPEGATTTYTFVDVAWAHRWPSEEIWIARKRG